MDNTTLKNAFVDLIKGIDYKENYSLKNFSKYKTGGNAKFLVIPKTTEEFIRVLNVAKSFYPTFILGAGSNVLISDKGYDGVVISTLLLNRISLKSNLLTAECGAKLCDVIKECSLNCLGGLEFAIGIPATIGGAVAMNAGCYNQCVSNCICYVVTDKATYRKDECEFSYRNSRFLNGEAIVKVCFSLSPSEDDIIEEKINMYKGLRRTPKGRSCGSVFRNDGFFAGKVIDDAGLKGFSYNKAKISLNHANYIIAEEGCTSSDIYKLIHIIKEKVYNLKQVVLNEEIIYLGEF